METNPLAKPLESYGEQIADKWGNEVFGPLLFLVGGAGAYTVRHGARELAGRIESADLGSKILVCAAVAGGVLGLTLLCRVADTYVLHFLEGYWPRVLRLVRRRCVTGIGRRRTSYDRRWQILAQKAVRSEDEDEEYARIDAWLGEHPTGAQLMPTRLGNVLRTMELRPGSKYGLEAMVCWSRLWLVIPDETKKAVTESRERMDGACRMWLLGLLTLVWSVFTWWSVLVAILICALAQAFLLDSARTYATIVESAFDVHRWKLYEELHWPTPRNAREERECGRRLTEYLLRGSDSPGVVFAAPIPQSQVKT